jgi:hypothetical protein
MNGFEEERMGAGERRERRERMGGTKEGRQEAAVVRKVLSSRILVCKRVATDHSFALSRSSLFFPTASLALSLAPSLSLFLSLHSPPLFTTTEPPVE